MSSLDLTPIVSRVRLDVCWKKSADGIPYCTKKPLTENKIIEHLAGANAYGCCPIKPGESTTMVAVLDLDSHKGDTSWADMCAVAEKIALASTLNVTPFSSSGGNGIHLYFLWDTPQGAYSVRQYLRGVLSNCGFSDGTAGVSNNQVEIFPKQDSVPADGFGSMFILPYAGDSVPLEPQLDYQKMGRDYPVTWATSLPVPVIQKPEASIPREPIGISGRLVGALNSIDVNLLSYGDWLRIGQAIHHETSGDVNGYLLWDKWSSLGRDYPGQEETDYKWSTFGRASSEPVKAGSLFKLAVEHGWVDMPTADDFVDISDEHVDPIDTSNPLRFNILPWSEFAAARSSAWLVKQVLPKAALIVIYGPPGGGKSFWVLDAVNSIARGEQWRGKKVNQGGVLYICAEGAGGFRNRLAAYAEHHQVDSTMPVYVLGDAPNLINKSDTPALLKAIDGLGPLSVIVVDTFAQVTPGSNENSSEGAGLALKNCRLLHDKTGATVILVAHSGKDATKGVRGWSGIKGACDCEIEITRVEDSDLRIAAITKQKDGEDQEQKYPFRLVTVPIGTDEDEIGRAHV